MTLARSAPRLRRANPAADLTAGVRFYEYTSAADPRVPQVPIEAYPSSLHRAGKTRVIPFDLSAVLKTDYPATTPNLLAAFLRIEAGNTLTTDASATSHLVYAIRGNGRTRGAGVSIDWSEGDLFVLPTCAKVTHRAETDAALYWVNDEPLLRYLGAKPAGAKFKPTVFKRARLFEELNKVRNQPGALGRNRTGILLGNEATPLTLTITHVLWSLLNVLPAGVVQMPHRHNSVAVDFCIDAGPNTYTTIGTQLGADGMVKNGHKAYWTPGSVFITPPGWWHSHHNESTKDALVLPIQDAGLQTYMRTLDIRFSSGPKAAEQERQGS